ncbi:MAG: hypothetical protein WC702_04760 [Patescibacteria group bacterium]|jgi:hypothetical protein
MRGNAAALKKLVPTVFADSKVRFDENTGEPILVVRIVKKVTTQLAREIRVLVITTEPELNTKGMAEKLNSFAFDDEKIYELHFDRDGLKTCLVDDVVVEATKNPGLREFLSHYFHNCCTAVSDLDKTLGRLPSVEQLTGDIEREVEPRLVEAFTKGNPVAFVTGPTNIVPICPCKATMLDPLFLDVLGMVGGEELKTLNKKRAELEAMARDKATLVTIVPVECRNIFFNLAATIIVAAIEALLPDIVQAEQDKIAVNAGAAIAALHDARRATAEASTDMTEA